MYLAAFSEAVISIMKLKYTVIVYFRSVNNLLCSAITGCNVNGLCQL